MYRVKGYLIGRSAEINRTEVDTLEKARAVAEDLKRKGFFVGPATAPFVEIETGETLAIAKAEPIVSILLRLRVESPSREVLC